MSTWRDTPTQTIPVDGTPFAYRELGNASFDAWLPNLGRGSTR